MLEDLKAQYYSIIKANENVEEEIECLVRQKLNTSQDFINLIKAQSKLNNAEKLLRNILENIEKYQILADEINQQKQIANQNRHRKIQYKLDKKYAK